ncbi:alpha-L-fucosidase [Luteolibacter ambystomatis]|uniref:alpha-L-fucosidase n=1 Tax=Luteolibacter ambystomatis TaxID=2824561 RepID=A0A975IXV3_9BACT|nr:alpha-L-fucosidase [Luteolibacter ambystomatis]QUE49577.1 alpha-L-fucosidase [Luteolibacter ambystomatis]
MSFLSRVLPALALMASAWAASPPAPFGAVPAGRQVEWQRMEYYAFVHFGLNTWTDREWGYGDEDPKLFNPSSFDARVIVRQFKEAGMTGVVLTAKHHDGFCLWPTKTTDRNISKSAWQGGKGDLVRDFAQACKAEGMKFGVYVSPWDRSQPEYGREGYVKVFHEQIREVLGNYGPVFEIWFDGANGGDGWYGGAKETRKIPPNYYDFPKIVEMVRRLQPQCVVWGGGESGDARWGGSEQGHVGYPHWATLDSKRGGSGAIGFAHGDRWVPAEGDTSIRHGWFWHQREDSQVKSPDKLLQVWFDCVGRGANLILNVPPNRTGQLSAPDIASLNGFRELREIMLSKDFARGAKAAASFRGSDAKFAPGNLTDGNIDSYWTVDDGNNAPSVEIRFAAPATFDVIRLREQIRLGQRVEGFALDAWQGDDWKEIHKGSTIGNQVLARLSSSCTTDRLRLRITASPAVPCISELAVFRAPVMMVAPSITRDAAGKLSISVQGAGTIRYTTDGSDPSAASTEYREPVVFPSGGTVKARIVAGDKLGPIATRALGMVKTGWKVVSATAGDARNAMDENPKTLWQTHPTSGELPPPQGFVIDLGAEVRIAGFSYLPRQDGIAHGMTDRYRFEVSRDGQTWSLAAEGEFSNIKANPIEQIVPLQAPVSARYFRFTGLHAVEKNHVTAAEVGVIAAP